MVKTSDFDSENVGSSPAEAATSSRMVFSVPIFADGDPGGSPLEVIKSVEDWTDYPPTTISSHMAQRLLDALRAAGYDIIRRDSVVNK